MHRKSQALLPPSINSHLHPTIFGHLSFKSLTLFAEEGGIPETHRQKAELSLRRRFPLYANLWQAWRDKDYAVLIDNLVARVANLLADPAPLVTEPKTEETYKQLCSTLGHGLRSLIGNHLFSNRVDNAAHPQTAHDLVFHFCRYSPEEAGKMLNRNILRLWSDGNRCVAYYLIRYGAEVNAVERVHGEEKEGQSTLFHALTFNTSEEMLRLLIEHGADYHGYAEIRHGVKYTLMLITALNGNQEALSVLVEKFPGEVNTTLETLEMMASRRSDTEFSREFGAFKPYNPHTWKPDAQFYSVETILRARQNIQDIVKANAMAAQRSMPQPPPARESGPGSPGKSNLFPPRPHSPMSADHAAGQTQALPASREVAKMELS